MKATIRTLGLALAIVILGGCDTSKDSGDSFTVSALKGTWNGALFYNNVYALASITTDGKGNITNVSLGGSTSGVTGTIEHVEGQVFGYRMTDGGYGWFLIDNSKKYLGSIDESDYTIGTFQKDGSGYNSASFSNTDIIGSWSGYSVDVLPGLEIDDLYKSKATVSSATPVATWSADSSNGSSVGTFYDYTANLGIYLGEGVGDNGSNDVMVWLSTDKKLAFSIGCRDEYTSIGYGSSFHFYVDNFAMCSFSVWNKK